MVWALIGNVIGHAIELLYIIVAPFIPLCGTATGGRLDYRGLNPDNVAAWSYGWWVSHSWVSDMLLSRLLGKRWGRGRSVVSISMIACAAFVALAVWGWGLPGAVVVQFLLLSLAGLAVIILAALAVVASIVLIRKLKKSLQRRQT